MNRDSDFKVVRGGGSEGSGGEEIEIIKLQRVNRSSGKGQLKITISYSEFGVERESRGFITLRCDKAG
jgi:hypothetical protein